MVMRKITNEEAIAEIEKHGLAEFFKQHPNARLVLNESGIERLKTKPKLCPHGNEILEPRPPEVDWDKENESQRDAFYSGDENVESGTCLCCGHGYEKNISDSNLSRSGYCTTCGWNP